ncbi:toll/interleukin-1 receptor domain-containing protein [Kribbella sp. NPDC050281]|uniref:toll/interleukin-1 receptor domain-containing protein n=1 Tax=Kribbella sp. NPDC050281 TaxID=3155515 RepID=UPI0033FE7F0A
MSEDAAQRVVIFLSYRRGDTQWAARGIYDRLVNRYGRKNVFRDLDAIPPGARFRDYVESKISESDVLILLIGKAWASYADETGQRRLEQARDPVRLEVETALRLGLPIIPVRVEGALMPTEGDLVPSIIDLLEFNAAEVTDSRWDYDVDRLLWAIDETVEGRLRPSAPNSTGDRDAEEKAGREAEEKARRDAEARRNAEEKARREAEEKARREAEEKVRREAEVKAGREAEEKVRRDAEARARRNAEEKARREAEEKARRDTGAWAGRDAEEAEQQARTDPQAAEERALAAASSSPEVVEWDEPPSSGTARILSRRWAKILAAALAVGGLVVLISYLRSAMSVEATIMSHVPDDLRASCTATDKRATCHMKDGTVVFYVLFDTVTEAKEFVRNEQQIQPDSQPCPPHAPPPVNTSVVCQYAVGPDKGLAMFSYTAKGTHDYYLSRWVSDAEPLLLGEMSTENANPLDWTTFESNWTWLVKAR